MGRKVRGYYESVTSSFPEVSAGELWRVVAGIRRRSGDREGADRAMRNARMSSGRTIVSIRPRSAHPPEYYYQTHLQEGPGHGHAACGSPPHRTTSDLKLVTCGNCKRTCFWREQSSAEAS
jgi:hypothetical protein